MKKIDLVGQKYGRLTVVAEAAGSGRLKWQCVCVCGNSKIVYGENLRAGRTQSCGCLHREVITELQTTHGQYHHPLFATWKTMHRRCYDPKYSQYKDYGGRGITVCPEWHEFQQFAADMGERPEGMTLDRRDNDLGYSPSNCRWATWVEQANNKRAA